MHHATFAALLRALLPLAKPDAYRLECDEPLGPDEADPAGPLVAQLRCVTFEPGGSVSQMLEQRVPLVYAEHRAHPSIEAYLRASVTVARARLDAMHEDAVVLPSELFLPEALGLSPSGDEAAFAALLGDEALRSRLLEAREERETRASHEAIVGASYADATYRLLRTGYELETDPWCDEVRGTGGREPPAPGASRLGGAPDLPEGFAWPRAGGSLMTFVAQVDLAALPPLPAGPDAALLPATGVLSFFLDMSGGDGVAEPPLRGPGRLLYFADRGALRPARLPNRGDYYVPLAAYTARARPRRPELPSHESPHYALALDAFTEPLPEAHTAYERVAERASELLGHGAMRAWVEHQPRHRLLGYPDALQADPLGYAVHDECVSANEPPPPEGSRAQAERAAQWRLVLQIDSDEDFALGDNGRAYVLMREDDLRERRFERARVVWQMH